MHIMTDNTGLPAAGWQDDPEDSAQLRYWDGNAWTEHRSPKAGVAQPAAAQPAAASMMVQDAAAPKKSGAPWWLVAALSVVSLVIGIGIGFGIGAVASGGDDTVAAPVTSADETPASEDATGADPTSPEPTSPEPVPDAGGGAGTATDPVAIDTPWTYDASWFGEDATQWEGNFEGLVSIPVQEWEEDQSARCFAVIGTMSPTSIADDAFTTNSFDTPTIEVVVGGKVEDEYGSCNTESLDAAGYASMWDAEVSVGTEFKFYKEVFLPSTVTGDVELLILGSASDADALFYQPTPASVG